MSDAIGEPPQSCRLLRNPQRLFSERTLGNVGDDHDAAVDCPFIANGIHPHGKGAPVSLDIRCETWEIGWR